MVTGRLILKFLLNCRIEICDAAKPNKSLDASGGSAFLNLPKAAEGALIRAAASTQTLDASRGLARSATKESHETCNSGISQVTFILIEGENMSDKSMSKTAKVAIALAIIAGLLALSRALYNYTQNGKLDIGKIALGIGIPCLMYAIVKSAASGK
jgi:hypothetical protein